MSPRLATVLTLAVLLCARAGAQAADEVILASQPGNTVSYEVGNAMAVAFVDRDGISSADVRLRRHGARYHGRVGRQQMELALEDGRVTGTIGDRAVALVATREQGHLKITGPFGAREIALVINTQSLLGQVGPCRYELSFQRGAYSGHVMCGGRPLPVRLAIPVSLAARSDAEIAVMLTALLAR